MKNIEWLKKEMGTEMIQLEPNRKERWSDVKYQTLRSVAQKFNQLDEQEVLSQEWIDEHSDGPSRCQYVWVDYLKELLVPKQESPVIPKYVGEFIEEVKASGDRLDDAFSILRGIYHQSKTADWVAKENRNSEIFARAWLDGYEVEEEQKYYALIKGHELMTDEGIWDCRYWNLSTFDGVVFPSDRFSQDSRFLTKMSKEDWNRYGINDSNADFVKVEDVE